MECLVMLTQSSIPDFQTNYTKWVQVMFRSVATKLGVNTSLVSLTGRSIRQWKSPASKHAVWSSKSKIQIQMFEDSVWDFKYMRKVVSEVEKNNQLGSNSQCHGVIPDMLIDGVLNPLSYMQTYISLLPTEPHQEKGKIFLFPMCRNSRHSQVQPP